MPAFNADLRSRTDLCVALKIRIPLGINMAAWSPWRRRRPRTRTPDPIRTFVTGSFRATKSRNLPITLSYLVNKSPRFG